MTSIEGMQNILNPVQDSSRVRKSTTPEHAGGRRENTRRVACKDCRQAKLRCDKASDSVEPCARCRRLSLDCRIDMEYKRYNKKAKLNELAEQVEKLQTVLNNQTTTRPQWSPDATKSLESPRMLGGIPSVQSSVSTEYVPYTQEPRNLLEAPAPPQFQTQPRPTGEYLAVSVDGSGASQARSIENVSITKEQVLELFQIFFAQYHHFFDILDPSLTPDQSYSRSTLLFWAIVSVAARHYEGDCSLYSTLRPLVKKLLWETISILPHSRETIQGILLIAMWPFPSSSSSTDITFLLASIAKPAAMQLGFHRPEIVQDFLRVRTQLAPKEFQETVQVWAGCFIASQCVSSSIGQPSTFTSDWAIDNACELGNQYTLHENLRHHLLIYKFMAKVNGFMADNERSSSGPSTEHERVVLVSLLEHDYLELERQISHKITAAQQILLLMVFLQLRTYYFFMKASTEIRKQGLLKAYSTAITLMLKCVDADRSWGFMKYAPQGFMSILSMAAMLVVKIIHSSYSKYIDVAEGKRVFDTMVTEISDRSYGPEDMRRRMSRVLSGLWAFHHSLTIRRQQEPTLSVKSRLGASVFHDELWTFRDWVNAQRNAAQQGGASREAWDDEKSTPQAQDIPYTMDSGESGTIPQTLGTIDWSQEFTDDWVWDMGFPSLLPIDLDSFNTTSGPFY